MKLLTLKDDPMCTKPSNETALPPLIIFLTETLEAQVMKLRTDALEAQRAKLRTLITLPIETASRLLI
jgi:hypothetical protein